LKNHNLNRIANLSWIDWFFYDGKLIVHFENYDDIIMSKSLDYESMFQKYISYIYE